MRHLIFVAPFALPSTLRFVRAAVEVPDIQVSLLSQEPVERLPAELCRRLTGFGRVRDAMVQADLVDGIRGVAQEVGGRVDRVIGVLEQMQVPLAEARAELQIPGLSVESARNFRDKSRMKDVLRANGLPCARHALATNASEALRFIEELGGPVVVKPPAGAGAKNTFRVDMPEQLTSYLRTKRITPDSPMLLEEFITGKEHSFDSVTLDGEHLLHSVTEYYPTPLEVMETPWIQWCVVLPRSIDGGEYEAILADGPKAIDCLGLETGLTHMEWFQRSDGSIAISEVAARPPGAQFTTLLSYAYDLDFYQAWARLMATDRFDVPERRWSVGAAFLRGQGAGSVTAVHGIAEARREFGDLVVEAKVPRRGQPQASSYEGEGYVILKDRDTDTVRDGLKRLISLIRVELG